MRRGNFIWGLIIIVAGLLFLLQNLGFLALDAWKLIWPAALIILGAWFLLAPRMRAADLETKSLDIPLESSRSAEVTLGHGAGRLEVNSAAAPGQLLRGTFVGGVESDVRRTGDRAVISLKAPFEMFSPGPWMAGRNQGFTWRVGLSPEVTLALRLKMGASENTIDLTSLRVSDISVETGASSTVLVLPAAAGFTRLEIHAGAASIDVRVPADVAARIKVSSGLSGIDVDSLRFPRSGEFYQSAGYETAQNRVDVTVEAGVGSIKIR